MVDTGVSRLGVVVTPRGKNIISLSLAWSSVDLNLHSSQLLGEEGGGEG